MLFLYSPKENEKYKMKTKQELIQQIESGDFSLSFSALKNFAVSPDQYVRYKLQKKESTPAMNFGSALHCAVLEPEIFPDKYGWIDYEQKPNPTADFRNTENKNWKAEKEAELIASGKKIISIDDYKKLIEMQEALYRNKESSKLLMALTETEKPLEFKAFGFKWRGIMDGKSDETKIILDLKKVTDANPERQKFAYFYELYHAQLAIYRAAAGLDDYRCFNIFIDDNMQVGVIEYSEATLQKGLKHLKYLCTEFRRCIFEEAWDESFDFYNGVVVV